MTKNTIVTFDKIQESNNKNINQPTIIEFKSFKAEESPVSYGGHTRLVFEHVLHQGNNKKRRGERYRGGTYGVVKKVFSVEDKKFSKPVCAVKIIKKKNFDSAEREFAEREFKANCLLGRTTLWAYRNGKYYVFIPWINGVNLNEYLNDFNKFYFHNLKMTFPYYDPLKRKNMFSDYLDQVAILHEAKLILGDPKPENTMVDFDHNTLVVTDLDAVHSQSTTKWWGFTPQYLPPNLSEKTVEHIQDHYSQKDDIYIMGNMLYQFIPEMEDNKYQDLYSLFRDMTHANRFFRIPVDQCLERLKSTPVEEKKPLNTDSKIQKKVLPRIKLWNESDFSGHTVKENVTTFSNYIKELRNYINQDQPMKLPFYDMETRLQMFLNYCETIKNYYEKNSRLIDPKNKCIFDDKKNDFILDEKIDSDKFKNYNLPPNLVAYKKAKDVCTLYCQKDDIYILGIMLAELFPEYYQVKIYRNEDKSPEIQSIQNPKFPINKTAQYLNQLISGMVKRHSESRPSISQSIEHLNRLKKIVQSEFPKPIVEEKPAEEKEEKCNLDEYQSALTEIISSSQPRGKKLSGLLGLAKEWIQKSPSQASEIGKIYREAKSRISTPINFGYRQYEALYRKIPTNDHLPVPSKLDFSHF